MQKEENKKKNKFEEDGRKYKETDSNNKKNIKDNKKSKIINSNIKKKNNNNNKYNNNYNNINNIVHEISFLLNNHKYDNKYNNNNKNKNNNKYKNNNNNNDKYINKYSNKYEEINNNINLNENKKINRVRDNQIIPENEVIDLNDLVLTGIEVIDSHSYNKSYNNSYNSSYNKSNNNNSSSNNNNSSETVMPCKSSNLHFNKLRKIDNNYDLISAKNIKIQILNLKNEIKINIFNFNLIFFYELLEQENIDLFYRLRLEIIGNFFGVQDINILMKLFNKINETNEPFILIYTGSSYVKINKICSKLKNITHIIIFCMEKYKYIHFLNEINSKVKLVSDNIYEINNFLKSTKFPSFNLTISEEIDNKPFISFYEYKNYYYLLHKILSFFFLENFSNLEFSYDYMQKVLNYINYHTNLSFNERNQLNKKIEKLYNSNNFLKDSLKLYTSEKFYHFNKTMRKIELGVA